MTTEEYDKRVTDTYDEIAQAAREVVERMWAGPAGVTLRMHLATGAGVFQLDHNPQTRWAMNTAAAQTRRENKK